MMTDELKAMCGDASLNCLYAFSELAENADRKIAERRDYNFVKRGRYMSDLISRETVRKGLGDIYDRMRNDTEYVNSPESLFLLATAFTKVDHVIDCTPVVEPKQGEWISVEDRLPEKDGKFSYRCLACLDWGDNKMVVEGVFCYESFSKYKAGEWYCIKDLGSEPQRYFITHWMPLPEPPKGVTDAET